MDPCAVVAGRWLPKIDIDLAALKAATLSVLSADLFGSRRSNK